MGLVFNFCLLWIHVSGLQKLLFKGKTARWSGLMSGFLFWRGGVLFVLDSSIFLWFVLPGKLD